MDVVLESPTGQRTMVTLGDRIGPVGSQGEVRAVISAPAAVVKLVRNPTAFRLEERLEAMFAATERTLIARGKEVRLAWPLGRARRPADNALIGYLQPRLCPPRFVPLREIFHDQLRAALLPAATWEWYVAVAASVVATVDKVSAHGHVIGDLAPDNLFVTADAHVAVVDVDGWQLARPGHSQPLPCPFSRPEYTAPEHLSGQARGVLREPSSDRWALAALVGQILCLGCHPFAGIAADKDPPFDEPANVLARRCWLTGTPMALPAGTPPRTFLPRCLRDLIASCFGAGHDQPGRRPTAAMWLAALQDVQANLATCTKRASHRFSRELDGCPWCEIIIAGGPDRFSGSAQAPGVGGRSRGAA